MTGDSISALEKYRELNATIFRLYAADRQHEALALLDEPLPGLEPWRAELAHLRACLHGSVGEHQEALEALAAAHAAGSWWDPRILVEDDDLAGLTEFEGFGALVESSRARWEHAIERLDRSGDRLALPAAPPRGLVVALHGAEEDADDAMAAWRPATSRGFAVLAVRSSQRTSPNYRTWPDATRAAAEIADAHRSLGEGLRHLPVVAAGFSAGGRVALRWALTGDPQQVAGVIAVAPAVSADDLPRPGVDGALLPALLVVGEDDDLADDVGEVASKLAPDGFTLDVVPGVGHCFPDDFPERLAAALDAV